MKTTLIFLSVLLSVNLFGQNVYIPDPYFKAYLVTNSNINTNGDTEIQVSEATAFAGWMECADQNISDLTGIEAFTALIGLDVSDNLLSSLDLSQNTNLIAVYCNYNSLLSLNVSQNTDLEELECAYNSLTSLDVSQNTALIYLDCKNNLLTTLDVSQIIVLQDLYVHDNLLTSIDVSQNTSLYTLDCSDNQLSSLDVSQNYNLQELDCNENLLINLNLYGAIELYDLDCSDNLLTSLDVSQNPQLFDLSCSSNQLTCLNLANSNTFELMFGLICGNNPSLTCIEVSDAALATEYANEVSGLEPQMYFSEDCSYAENCFDSTVGISELTTSKDLIQILDMMGRETSFKPNTPLIYVYDDGSREKVFSLE